MNHQEKQTLIADYVSQINNGLSWDEFQAQLTAITDVQQKDIVSANFKVMNALDAKYGKTVEKQLARSGNVASIHDLHETVVAKLVKRKKIHTKIKLRRSIFTDSGRFTSVEIAGGIALFITVIIKLWMKGAFN